MRVHIPGLSSVSMATARNLFRQLIHLEHSPSAQQGRPPDAHCDGRFTEPDQDDSGCGAPLDAARAPSRRCAPGRLGHRRDPGPGWDV
jgi:hypothetical protein